MKKTFTKTVLLIAGLSLAAITSATKHVVTVQNFSFSPSSFTATVGDTVEWQWVAGTHTTTSLTIPASAASWDSPMTTSNRTFDYVITQPGTYNYWCAIHTTMMEASFTATIATGTPAIGNPSQPIAKIFPNPATGIVNIHLNIHPNTNVLIITDMLGKEVVRETLTNTDNTIDVSTWKNGVYFYQLEDGTATLKGRLEVTN